MKELVVVAIGGNSIIKDNASQSIEHQAEAVKAVADTVLEMLASDYDIVLTHGNGPQVGLDLRRAEIAHEREGLPLTPLANCVADTQGGIGYLDPTGAEQPAGASRREKAVTVVTQVEVDKTIRDLPIPPSPSAHSSVKASVTNYKRQTLTGVLLKMPDGAIAAWSPRRNRNVLSKHPPLRR